jgi:hypothetical protein
VKVKKREDEPPARSAREPMMAWVDLWGPPQPRLIRVAPGLFAPTTNPDAFDLVPPPKDET